MSIQTETRRWPDPSTDTFPGVDDLGIPVGSGLSHGPWFGGAEYDTPGFNRMVTAAPSPPFIPNPTGAALPTAAWDYRHPSFGLAGMGDVYSHLQETETRTSWLTYGLIAAAAWLVLRGR